MADSNNLPTARAGIDDQRWRPFHFRMTAFVGGGQFVDGYVLGIVGLSIFLMPTGFLTPFWMGLIASSALVGLAAGAIFGGWLTDKIGRVNIYMFDLSLFVVASLLQLFVTNPGQLFVLRLLLGIAIGLDYAVGPTYLAEFLPKKGRGRVLGGGLVQSWNIGFVSALLMGAIGSRLLEPGPNVWRLVIASSAIPAAIVLILRIGSPESPRWLVNQGRIEEAKAICAKYLPGVSTEDLLAERKVSASFREILRPVWLKRVIFIAAFWSALAWPSFAISTFLPQVLDSLGFDDPDFGSVFLRSLPILGAIVGMWAMIRLGRRTILLSALFVQMLIFSVLAIMPNAAGMLIAALIGGWFLVLGFTSVVEFLYGPELFPTDIRAWGVGLGSAGSRIGAALGTFLLPIIMAGPGLRFAMFLTALLTLVGLLVSFAWGPETKGRSLLETSAGDKLAPTEDAGRG